MSEFKGTKVFPKYKGGDNYSIDMIFDSEATISIDRRSRYTDKVIMSREEMEANAKLIACAPEMLELLKRTMELQEQHVKSGCNTHFININEIDNLIKKATL